MQMLKVRKVKRTFSPLLKYKRAGLKKMHTDLVVDEMPVDPDDSDTVEM